MPPSPRACADRPTTAPAGPTQAEERRKPADDHRRDGTAEPDHLRGPHRPAPADAAARTRVRGGPVRRHPRRRPAGRARRARGHPDVRRCPRGRGAHRTQAAAPHVARPDLLRRLRRAARRHLRPHRDVPAAARGRPEQPARHRAVVHRAVDLGRVAQAGRGGAQRPQRGGGPVRQGVLHLPQRGRPRVRGRLQPGHDPLQRAVGTRGRGPARPVRRRLRRRPRRRPGARGGLPAGQVPADARQSAGPAPGGGERAAEAARGRRPRRPRADRAGRRPGGDPGPRGRLRHQEHPGVGRREHGPAAAQRRPGGRPRDPGRGDREPGRRHPVDAVQHRDGPAAAPQRRRGQAHHRQHGAPAHRGRARRGHHPARQPVSARLRVPRAGVTDTPGPSAAGPASPRARRPTAVRWTGARQGRSQT
ncbi:hypothetical protein SGPA1_50627 [Streptomyces misionensis JCM 4497]